MFYLAQGSVYLYPILKSIHIYIYILMSHLAFALGYKLICIYLYFTCPLLYFRAFVFSPCTSSRDSPGRDTRHTAHKRKEEIKRERKREREREREREKERERERERGRGREREREGERGRERASEQRGGGAMREEQGRKTCKLLFSIIFLSFSLACKKLIWTIWTSEGEPNRPSLFFLPRSMLLSMPRPVSFPFFFCKPISW